MLANRTTAIGLVSGCLRQYASQVIGGTYKDIRDDLIAPVIHLFPAPMGGFQKTQVTKIVNFRDRPRTLVRRLQHRDAHFLQSAQHFAGSSRNLLGLAHLSPGKVRLWNVLILCGMEKCLHCTVSWVSDPPSIGTLRR